MRNNLPFILLILIQWHAVLSTIQIGLITNVSSILATQFSITLFGSCTECICAMVTNSSYFVLNCFSSNRTCQLYRKRDQNKSYFLQPDNRSRFYFLSLPSYTISKDIIWDFDGTIADRTGIFTGRSSGILAYINSSITGDDNSFSLSSSSAQGEIYYPSPISLSNRSWTFEGWIYMNDLSSTVDNGIIGHCELQATAKCLHLNVRRSALYFGFYVDDLPGTRILLNKTWYHFAFTFDCSTRERSIYLDGIQDVADHALSCYQASYGNLTLGLVLLGTFEIRFDGLIDQVSFTNQTKSATEILDDATLTAYFSFDSNSFDDQGPLKLKASTVGNVTLSMQSIVSGSMMISNFSDSYLLIRGFVRLGISFHPYSFSLWIKPIQVRQSTLVHVSSSVNGGTPWCVPFLGLTNTGRLYAALWSNTPGNLDGPLIQTGTWTHIALTYGSSNIHQLYVNGSLYNSSALPYIASQTSNYVLIGSIGAGTVCYAAGMIGGQYYGFIDELRIYSRELTASDIASLAS